MRKLPQHSLLLERLECRLLFYAQAVHQWISTEAYDFYADQFGASRLDSWIGRVSAGTFDEDEPGRNPFGDDSTLNHPSTRHFWGHNASFQRTFDDGYSNYDSAPNRAIKYLTGGYGYTDILDSNWNAGAGQGGAALYAAANYNQAYYFLGHAAHLLQDINLPAHSHNDAHLEGFGALDDPDPYHDWADGVAFSTSGAGDLPVAAFNEAADADRAAAWALGAGANSALLRSASDIYSAFTPGAANVDSEPLYRLFTAVAGLADDYDTKDVNGQVDAGSRRNNSSDYDNWTRAELVQIAETLIPRAIVESAELYRYFHGVVDSIAPLAASPGLTSGNVASPQAIGSSFTWLAAATDQVTGDTGVGKDLFVFEFREQLSGGGWGPWQTLAGTAVSSHFTDGDAYGVDFANRHGAIASMTFSGTPGTVYGLRVSAEDGAGNLSVSNESFVRVAPVQVVSGELIALGTPGDDTVEFTSPAAGKVAVNWNGVAVGEFTASRVTAEGGDGADSIVMRPSRYNPPVVFRGGNGPDSLIGGYGHDQLFGDVGDDFLAGDRGNDELWGGPGRDTGFGRLGNDILHGGDDNDKLRGDLGDDVVMGDLGKDTVRGDAGNDVVLGNDGGDRLYGDDGRDLLLGGLGVDYAVGGNEDDILIDGPTSHDSSVAALLALLAEWASAKAYGDRTQNLINGSGAAPALNGVVFLSAQTTRDDRRDDLLHGELGQDWFPRNEAQDAVAGERIGF